MSEREVVVDKYRITYEGLFSVVDLYTLIDEWLEDKGYDKVERNNIERVAADGKYIELRLEPFKKLTDYAKSIINLRIIMDHVKDANVEKDGVKVAVNQGTVQIVIDSFIETDYEHHWEMKPMFFFIRTLFDKYVFTSYIGGFKNEIGNDTKELGGMIKSFLNLYRTEK